MFLIAVGFFSFSETSLCSVVMTRCLFLKIQGVKGKEKQREKRRESGLSFKLGCELDSFICLGHMYASGRPSAPCRCGGLQALSLLSLLFPLHRMPFSIAL